MSDLFQVVAHPCCVPSKQRARQLEFSRQASGGRIRAEGGSTDAMIKLDGGRFLMGTESPEGFPADGEGPVREVTIDPVFIDKYPVTNLQFAEFIRATGYKTEAERFGWSFVFHKHISPERAEARPVNTEWWCKVSGADWAHPEGYDSDVNSRDTTPV